MRDVANGSLTIDIYRYLVDLFKALPYAKVADDYEALLPWKLGKPARKPTVCSLT
ncbi:transposase domain-containing protein [Caballeronia sordidicola]|uniref:transposase domain-containing protein n=1 Tax=Caballeronia sordidicola TaxID=196367 RepID=UPI00117C0F34|nr:transposase domain-containing protein [Caballeronia sordidicola]